MSTAELKIDIINRITNLQDDDVLNTILNVLEKEANNETPYILSAAQKEAIQEARIQVAGGEVISSKEADKEIEEWLSEL